MPGPRQRRPRTPTVSQQIADWFVTLLRGPAGRAARRRPGARPGAGGAGRAGAGQRAAQAPAAAARCSATCWSARWPARRCCGLLERTDIDPWKPLIDLAVAALVFELGTRLRPRWLIDNPWLAASSALEAAMAAVVVGLSPDGVGRTGGQRRRGGRAGRRHLAGDHDGRLARGAAARPGGRAAADVERHQQRAGDARRQTVAGPGAFAGPARHPIR